MKSRFQHIFLWDIKFLDSHWSWSSDNYPCNPKTMVIVKRPTSHPTRWPARPFPPSAAATTGSIFTWTPGPTTTTRAPSPSLLGSPAWIGRFWYSLPFQSFKIYLLCHYNNLILQVLYPFLDGMVNEQLLTRWVRLSAIHPPCLGQDASSTTWEQRGQHHHPSSSVFLYSLLFSLVWFNVSVSLPLSDVWIQLFVIFLVFMSVCCLFFLRFLCCTFDLVWSAGKCTRSTISNQMTTCKTNTTMCAFDRRMTCAG